MMTKKDNKNFQNYAKYWICDKLYIYADVKITFHFHITGKNRGPTHRDCSIKAE